MDRHLFTRACGTISSHMQCIDAMTAPARIGAPILWLIWLAITAPGAAANDGALVRRGDETTRLSAELSREGWKLLSVPGKAEARFAQGGPNSIRVSAENAVAFLYRPVSNDMGPKRRLSWRWRVEQATPRTDLSQAGEDDRPLAVHVVFPVDSNRLSILEQINLAFTRLVAEPLAGKVLTYVWGGTQGRGARLPNPHLEAHGVIIVLRSGDTPTGRWIMEEIDFVADFRAAFGYNPPPPAYLAISSDSDDTAGQSLGVIADLVFGS
jgi:hypothetical protein